MDEAPSAIEESSPITEHTQAFPTGPQRPPSGGGSGWILGQRYRVLGRIGSGGMAEVFRARDEVLDREVAVKVFRAEHVARDDAHGVERQQLEVAALARLNHPNLIALYDGAITPESGPAYLVMELIDGPSLAARIADGPLPEPAVREIGIQLADGLAYVHSTGMVHRDVKPENILLGTDRSDDESTVRARLSDFGIVRLLGSERLTSVNFTLGTASYLAPEQARGSDVDPPADVYSLGLVLIEALSGVRSFDGPPLEAAVARLTTRPRVPAGLPEPWPGLLHAMTEFEPSARPSAAEVARVLRTEGPRSLPLAAVAVPVAAGFAEAPTGMMSALATPASPPEFEPRQPERRRRPNGMLIAAALSVLVIATTLGIFLFTGSDNKSPAQAPTTGTSTTPAADKPSTSPTHHRSSSAVTHSPTASATPTRSKSSSKPASSTSGTSSAPRTSSAPSTSTPPSSPAASSTPSSSAATTSITPSLSTTPAASSSAAAPAAAASSSQVAGG
jgi:serine/threonine protein kinase